MHTTATTTPRGQGFRTAVRFTLESLLEMAALELFIGGVAMVALAAM